MEFQGLLRVNESSNVLGFDGLLQGFYYFSPSHAVVLSALFSRLPVLNIGLHCSETYWTQLRVILRSDLEAPPKMRCVKHFEKGRLTLTCTEEGEGT